MGYAALGLATVLALATGSALAEEKPREGAQASEPRAEAGATTGDTAPEAAGDTAPEAIGDAAPEATGDAAPDETLPENSVDAEEGRNEDQDGDEIRVEESAILPNAEGHLESEAETMELDCENNPEDCVEPIEDPTAGPTLSDDADPATVQEEDADPVVARP